MLQLSFHLYVNSRVCAESTTFRFVFVLQYNDTLLAFAGVGKEGGGAGAWNVARL